jgi:hypothetical protein
MYTLLFRVLPRLRHDRASWSALARLMGAHIKALELQPGVGLCECFGRGADQRALRTWEGGRGGVNLARH